MSAGLNYGFNDEAFWSHERGFRIFACLRFSSLITPSLEYSTAPEHI